MRIPSGFSLANEWCAHTIFGDTFLEKKYSNMEPKHIPYEIDPDSNRMHFYENYWKRVGLDLLLRHFEPSEKTLLDVGCGRGETMDIFGNAGLRPSGVDLDPECVRLSSKHGKASVLDGAGLVKQFGERSFDVVTCFHVLEHVENPKQVLSEISSLAKEYVVLAVPNLRYLHRIFERQFDLSQVNEGHLQSWDHWHFRNLAERYCNLELIAWGSDATLLPFLSQLSSKLFGERFAIKLETGLFRSMFPYHCISVLGLFRPRVE